MKQIEEGITDPNVAAALEKLFEVQQAGDILEWLLSIWYGLKNFSVLLASSK